MAVAAQPVAALVSHTPRGVTADAHDGDVADIDTTAPPANGRRALDNALANTRVKRQDNPVDLQQLAVADAAGGIDAATLDERCGGVTARVYTNPQAAAG